VSRNSVLSPNKNFHNIENPQTPSITYASRANACKARTYSKEHNVASRRQFNNDRVLYGTSAKKQDSYPNFAKTTPFYLNNFINQGNENRFSSPETTLKPVNPYLTKQNSESKHKGNLRQFTNQLTKPRNVGIQ
jgi:hypothetical protein